MHHYQIAVIIGSLRKDSINRKFAHEVIALAPESLALDIVEIGEGRETQLLARAAPTVGLTDAQQVGDAVAACGAQHRQAFVDQQGACRIVAFQHLQLFQEQKVL